MGKGLAPHRIVTRDADNRIVGDEHFANFAEAEPIWPVRCRELSDGLTLTLQHGSREIKRWPR